MLWILANKYWRDPTFQEHIAASGDWLSEWMTRNHLSEHFYPEHTVNEPWGSELWWRLGIYAENGIDTSDFVALAYEPQWLAAGKIPFLYAARIPWKIYLVDFEPSLRLDVPLAGDPPNSISNPGFECSLSGNWTLRNASLDRTTRHRGLYSLRLRGGSPTSHATHSRIKVAPGALYEFSAYTRCPAGFATGVVSMSFYNAQNQLIVSMKRSFYSHFHWAQIVRIFPTPSDAFSADVSLRSGSYGSGNRVFIDTLSLTR
jgi:hypothetical protein